MFIVGAIAKDQTFSKDFVERDASSRLRLAKGQRKFLIRSGGQVPDKLKNLIKELEGEIGERGKGKKKGRQIQPIPTEQIAIIAQMEDFYDTVYRLASSPVHTSPLSLNQVFSVDRNGEVEALNYPPEVDNLGMWIFTATEMTLNTLYKITEHFSLDSSRRIEELELRLKALIDKNGVSPNFR